MYVSKIQMRLVSYSGNFGYGTKINKKNAA